MSICDLSPTLAHIAFGSGDRVSLAEYFSAPSPPTLSTSFSHSLCGVSMLAREVRKNQLSPMRNEGP